MLHVQPPTPEEGRNNLQMLSAAVMLLLCHKPGPVYLCVPTRNAHPIKPAPYFQHRVGKKVKNLEFSSPVTSGACQAGYKLFATVLTCIKVWSSLVFVKTQWKVQTQHFDRMEQLQWVVPQVLDYKLPLECTLASHNRNFQKFLLRYLIAVKGITTHDNPPQIPP